MKDAREVLSLEEWQKCEAMHDSLWRRWAARKVLDDSGPVELSIVWIDEETGVKCKARIDKLTTSGIVADYKTTASASRENFVRSIEKLGYYRQAAIYFDAVRAVGLTASDFVFLVVEKEPPHCFAAPRMREDSIEAGRIDYRRLLRLWRDCEQTGKWPGYGDEFQDIGLNDWKLKKIYNAEAA